MPETKPAPGIKLPADVARSLREQEPTIVRARKSLQVMKELGLETKMLEDKLDWAEKARKMMLKEFG